MLRGAVPSSSTKLSASLSPRPINTASLRLGRPSPGPRLTVCQERRSASVAAPLNRQEFQDEVLPRLISVGQDVPEGWENGVH
eukprot:CAMPEP_0114162624 /NCGR_PEP_ID=MMETSP0043_2-20121206/29623_1 /TAXON_ID=464988 /ORGANISM="Hemiselmis andersenii, Strain CCMP644" /LENGTH=82 /DNA_ID=CAMNT_0001259009 /DNA_START=256 /DNA_END=501 /DNA_ORIENTATION=+